jgi:two-component system, LytTR family, response regulator
VTYSVVIVEDEAPARAKLERWLAELPDFRLVARAASVDEGRAAVIAAAPDVLYLDIQLGLQSGFDVIDGIRGVAAPPLIVFTTAYSEHAVRAFDVQALDYLLKPFDRDRFFTSIARVRGALAEPDRTDVEERVRRLLAGLPDRPVALGQILVRDGERAFFLSVREIDRIAAAGNYVEVHSGGKIHLVRDSLTSFIAPLDTNEFLRVHRSHVVRLGFIAELRPLFHGDYELLLRDGTLLPLSRRYKALLPEVIRARL